MPKVQLTYGRVAGRQLGMVTCDGFVPCSGRRSARDITLHAEAFEDMPHAMGGMH
jgi:hypothetical protein